MPWPRNEPDPLKAKKQALADQERRLAEQMSRLTEELRNGGVSPAEVKEKTSEPPIWRMDDESMSRRMPEFASAGGRNLARQRRRDRYVFFACMVLLLVAMGIFIWLWKAHLRPE